MGVDGCHISTPPRTLVARHPDSQHPRGGLSHSPTALRATPPSTQECRGQSIHRHSPELS